MSDVLLECPAHDMNLGPKLVHPPLLSQAPIHHLFARAIQDLISSLRLLILVTL